MALTPNPSAQYEPTTPGDVAHQADHDEINPMLQPVLDAPSGSMFRRVAGGILEAFATTSVGRALLNQPTTVALQNTLDVDSRAQVSFKANAARDAAIASAKTYTDQEVEAAVKAGAVKPRTDVNGGNWDATFAYDQLDLVFHEPTGASWYANAPTVPGDEPGVAATWTRYSDGLNLAAANAAYRWMESVQKHGAVGDGVADDTDAIEAAIAAADFGGTAGGPEGAGHPLNVSGGVAFFPPGSYRTTRTITVPDRVSLKGAGRRSSQIVVDASITEDGIVYDGVEAPYKYGPSVSDLAIQAAVMRESVRDLIRMKTVGSATVERVFLRDAGRYGLHLEQMIHTGIVDTHIHGCQSGGLFVPAAPTTTTVDAQRLWVAQVKDGPCVDIAGLGMTFGACIFETAQGANGHGVLIRSGYAVLDSCYWEGIEQYDIRCGTDDWAHLTVNGFHSITGPFTDTSAGHLYVAGNTRQAMFSGGRYDRRHCMRIEPGHGPVMGVGMRMTGAAPITRTDSADIDTDGNLYVVAIDGATNWQRAIGRVDAKLRFLEVTSTAAGAVLLPNGTGSNPGVKFAGAGSTGIRGSGTDIIQFLAAAAERFRVSDVSARAFAPLRVDDGIYYAGEKSASSTVRDLRGTGSPEGIVSAPVGSTWRRSDGGAGTAFYVKESGTGSTGWRAV